MMFEYKGFDATGRTQSGLVEAADLKEARKILAARGILPETVQAARGTATRRGARAAIFSADVRTMFYRELAALLGSGVALAPALDVILQAPELDQARTLLAAVRDMVREGRALSAAMPVASPQVTLFEQAVLEVGERTGGMPEALARLAAFLEEQEKLREKLMTALLYPLIVVSLAVIIGGLVLTLLLPKVQSLFSEAQLELPALTRILLAGGRGLGFLLLLLVIGAGGGRISTGWPGAVVLLSRSESSVFRCPVLRPSPRPKKRGTATRHGWGSPVGRSRRRAAARRRGPRRACPSPAPARRLSGGSASWCRC